MELSLAALTVLIGFLVYRWHNDPKNTFNLTDALLGSDNKVSIFKIGQAAALVSSTWGLVVLIQQGKLTEWYFAAYMGVWAGANMIKTVSAQINGGANAGSN